MSIVAAAIAASLRSFVIATVTCPCSRASASTAQTSGDSPDCEMPMSRSTRGGALVEGGERGRGERLHLQEAPEHVLGIAGGVVRRSPGGDRHAADTGLASRHRRLSDRAILVAQQALNDRRLLGELLLQEGVAQGARLAAGPAHREPIDISLVMTLDSILVRESNQIGDGT